MKRLYSSSCPCLLSRGHRVRHYCCISQRLVTALLFQIGQRASPLPSHPARGLQRVTAAPAFPYCSQRSPIHSLTLKIILTTSFLLPPRPVNFHTWLEVPEINAPPAPTMSRGSDMRLETSEPPASQSSPYPFGFVKGLGTAPHGRADYRDARGAAPSHCPCQQPRHRTCSWHLYKEQAIKIQNTL